MSDALQTTREGYLDQKVRIFASPGFPDWLAEQKMTLLGAARDRNMLFCMGTDEDGQFQLYDRLFEGCSGLFRKAGDLYVSGRDRIWHLRDFADGVFHPKVLHHVGNVATHELIQDHLGRIVFANTQYSCLSAISSGAVSFEPVWAPPFIGSMAASDACHLNGVGQDANGTVRWVTGCGATGEPSGWRQMRAGGGWLMDRVTNETVAGGLSMPHSPREHEGTLYVLSSGAGFFGKIDRNKGGFRTAGALPRIRAWSGFRRLLRHYRVVEATRQCLCRPAPGRSAGPLPGGATLRLDGGGPEDNEASAHAVPGRHGRRNPGRLRHQGPRIGHGKQLRNRPKPQPCGDRAVGPAYMKRQPWTVISLPREPLAKLAGVA